MDVHGITPATAGIEHDRQLAGGAHVDGHFGQFRQRQVGFRDAFDPAERTAAEIDRLEPGLLRQPRHDRIERHRRDNEFVAGDEVPELLQTTLPATLRRRPRMAVARRAWGNQWQSSRSCARVRCTRWSPRWPMISPTKPATRSN